MKRHVKDIPEPVTLRIGEMIGSSYCVSSRDGERIYKQVAPLVESNTPVVISFEGVEIIIAAFLNVAVGQLYGKFDRDYIEKLISYQELSDQDMDLVRRVTKNAEIYFSRKSAYDRAWKEELGDSIED